MLVWIALILPESGWFCENQLASARITMLLGELAWFWQNWFASARITLLLRESNQFCENQSDSRRTKAFQVWISPLFLCFDLILAELAWFCQNQVNSARIRAMQICIVLILSERWRCKWASCYFWQKQGNAHLTELDSACIRIFHIWINVIQVWTGLLQAESTWFFLLCQTQLLGSMFFLISQYS